MKPLLLSLCLLALVVWASVQGTGMVKPGALTTVDARDIGYLNVRNNLGVIAASPHPTASARQAVVRRYLLETIAGMGYQVAEQPFRFTIDRMVNRQKVLYAELNEHQRQAFDAELARVGADSFEQEVRIRSGLLEGDSGQGTNLIASRRVQGATATVLFMAHYDSVGTAPGASDDGMAVASILQLMRDSITRSDAKNNVIFLLTDGEELGLLGAQHYVSQLSRTEREEIRLVLNFEARGNQGIPLLFETSQKDYSLIKTLNEGVQGIISFSFTPLIYKMLQNDTDFTVFREHNIAGLNFAVVEGFEHYHHMSDTVDNLAPETLFRYQKTVREVGNHFIHGTDLSSLSADEDATYFPLPGGTLLVINSLTMLGLGIASLVLCGLWALSWRINARHQGKHSVLRPTAVALLGIASAALAYSVPSVAYLVVIPSLLLACAMLMPSSSIGYSIMLLNAYACGILYAPIIYLVSSGLEMPIIAGIIACLPFCLLAVGMAGLIARPLRNKRDAPSGNARA
ncbi:M28 family metallopeptidase [Pseudomonas orientalis]|uniref:M28 family metallopeptidase n=1 Tax=Pseudomonas orientalis TaxID=76758 RepID=UPI002FE14E73